MMSFSPRELLARIVMCEAGGEGENGMKAVATVVMNRVHVGYGEYQRIGQGNLRNVVFQPGQFDCVMTEIRGRTNLQNIWNMRPQQIHYDIADWALAGNKLYNLGLSLWFFNPFIPTCPTYFPTEVGHNISRVVDHCFYNPTELYALT